MSTESIQVSGVIHASPDRIYQAWLDSNEHSGMTGGRATVDPMVGGQFTCWDGTIRGTTVELEPGRRIVQRWRSNDFPADSPDSRLEVLLEPTESGTRVTLLHSDIPEGQGTRLEEGWQRYYLDPMSNYFGEAEALPAEEEEVEPEPQRAAAPKPVAKPQAKAPERKAKPAAKKAKKAASARSSKKKPARKAASRKAAGKKSAARKGKAKKGKARSSSRKSGRRKR